MLYSTLKNIAIVFLKVLFWGSNYLIQIGTQPIISDKETIQSHGEVYSVCFILFLSLFRIEIEEKLFYIPL